MITVALWAIAPALLVFPVGYWLSNFVYSPPDGFDTSISQFIIMGIVKIAWWYFPMMAGIFGLTIGILKYVRGHIISELQSGDGEWMVSAGFDENGYERWVKLSDINKDEESQAERESRGEPPSNA